MKYLLLSLIAASSCLSATYYVSTATDTPAGNNSNAGTVGEPFLTIQKGLDSVGNGDTVYVNSGWFPERWVSTRHSAGGTPITVLGHNSTNRGFYLIHSNIVVKGFNIERSHATNSATIGAASRIAGANNRIENNSYGNPIAYLGTDVSFNNTNPDTITAPGVDFVAAGFEAGMYLIIERAFNTTPVANEGVYYLIGSVATTTITMDAGVAFTAAGPVNAYINSSRSYPINIENTAINTVVISNDFTRVAARANLIAGTNAMLVWNRYIECGHDLWVLNAGYYTITSNYVQGTLMNGFSDPSPDLWEKLTTVDKPGGVISYNWFQDWTGGIALHDDLNSQMDIHHNVFIGCQSISANVGNMRLRNNTFISVATANYAWAGGYRHCLTIEDGSPLTGLDYGNNISYNNIYALSGQVSATNGYYAPGTLTQAYVATNDFVVGPNRWDVKSGWPQNSALNGGDPGWVVGSGTNYLGADMLPFTADDGLTILVGSKLKGAGKDGLDIGAHAYVEDARNRYYYNREIFQPKRPKRSFWR